MGGFEGLGDLMACLLCRSLMCGVTQWHVRPYSFRNFIFIVLSFRVTYFDFVPSLIISLCGLYSKDKCLIQCWNPT